MSGSIGEQDRAGARRLIYDQIEQVRGDAGDLGDLGSRPRPVWMTLIRQMVVGAGVDAARDDDDQWRHRMLMVASLSVAAIEAHDQSRGLPIESEHTIPTEAPRFDPRCGSQGIDPDGHCQRCGLRVDPNDTETSCPPGFLVPDGSSR